MFGFGNHKSRYSGCAQQMCIKINVEASQRGIHTQPLLTRFCLETPKNYRTRCRNHFALGLINFRKFDPKTFHDEISIVPLLLVHKGDFQGFRLGFG